MSTPASVSTRRSDSKSTLGMIPPGLRTTSLLIESKGFDEALDLLNGVTDPAFDSLVADRKGDVFAAQGRKPDARLEYLKAYEKFDEKSEYRRLVEFKLNALGASLPESDK